MTTLVLQRGVAVLTGADSVADRVRRRLLFWRGEWLLNPLLGVNYNELLDSDGSVLDDITSKVLEVDGVRGASVSVRGFDGRDRRLTLLVELDTEFGARSVEVVA